MIRQACPTIIHIFAITKRLLIVKVSAIKNFGIPWLTNGVPLAYGLSLYQNVKFLDPSKLKEFADDNFKFVGNGKKFYKRGENTVGKEEIAHYVQFLLSPLCFQKTCTADT